MSTKYTKRSRFATFGEKGLFSNFFLCVYGNILEKIRTQYLQGIRDQGLWIRDPGSGIKDQGSGNREEGTGKREQETLN